MSVVKIFCFFSALFYKSKNKALTPLFPYAVFMNYQAFLLYVSPGAH